MSLEVKESDSRAYQPLSAVDREAQVRRLTAEIDVLERTEEALVSMALEHGLPGPAAERWQPCRHPQGHAGEGRSRSRG